MSRTSATPPAVSAMISVVVSEYRKWTRGFTTSGGTEEKHDVTWVSCVALNKRQSLQASQTI